jgi:multimeric flavodoxin WrbA
MYHAEQIKVFILELDRNLFHCTTSPPGILIHVPPYVQRLVDTPAIIWKTGRVSSVRIRPVMRKILGISASARVWGNCETSVKQVLSGAMEAGARTGFLRLTDSVIEPCRGCFRCLGEGGRCPLDDGLYGLLDRIEASDDLVLASPVYFLSASSQLVGLMDRLLTVHAYMAPPESGRRAVTLTLMGNRRWRGVAEPLVNLTASLLGFEIMESLGLVAEGPGEVIAGPETVDRLSHLGRVLAEGKAPDRAGRKGVCPVCRSDFFQVVPPAIVCPVCGLRGDLETYSAEGVFVARGEPERWGRTWLGEHIDSWIRPSLTRFLENRREILGRVRHLKTRYSEDEKRGKQDVH